MPSESELIAERLRKIEEFRKLGINPYPYKFVRTHTTDVLQKKYSELKPEEKTSDSVSVCGRILSFRKLGKIAFMKLEDGYGSIQGFFQENSLKNFDQLKLFDVGDFIGITGNIIRTKTKELSVDVKSFEILSKSIRPLPEKWHGLTDIEQRYRQRFVDLIMNPDVRATLKKRSMIVSTIRSILDSRDFLEVETPILNQLYGGAAARPFKSHLNSLKMDVYLRISNELALKRLVVGGYERVYEFAKDFRNEDIDRSHNPEFTQVEIYQAYADFEDVMSLTEDIYLAVAEKLGLGQSVEYQGEKISLKKPWQRMTMVEAIRKFAQIDVEKLDDRELFDLRITYNLEIKGDITRGAVIQALFEELAEDKLVQPTFITHHPIESTPLCKPARSNPKFAERFELFIAGMEMGNAYSELNDPVLQRKLLEDQSKQLRAGSEEAHPMDENFVQAIEYGMPPTGGVGLGIDRMCMILLNQSSIRDVIFFPFMK